MIGSKATTKIEAHKSVSGGSSKRKKPSIDTTSGASIGGTVKKAKGTSISKTKLTIKKPVSQKKALTPKAQAKNSNGEIAPPGKVVSLKAPNGSN